MLIADVLGSMYCYLLLLTLNSPTMIATTSTPPLTEEASKYKKKTMTMQEFHCRSHGLLGHRILRREKMKFKYGWYRFWTDPCLTFFRLEGRVPALTMKALRPIHIKLCEFSFKIPFNYTLYAE